MEIPYVQDGFQKGQGTKDIILDTHWIVRKPQNIKKKPICASLIIERFLIAKPVKLWNVFSALDIKPTGFIVLAFYFSFRIGVHNLFR